MIVINIWGADPMLNQRLASRLEYEFLTLNTLVGRIPAGTIDVDSLDMEEDFHAENLVDVVINLSPYPYICESGEAEAYYSTRSYGVLDIMVESDSVLYTQDQQELQTFLLTEGLDTVIDMVVEPVKVRYITRRVMDEYYKVKRLPGFKRFTNQKLTLPPAPKGIKK